jgi:diamine N-acetyltransferase
MNIRHATIDDQPALTAFGARTFRETFAADNTPEDMAAYLEAAFGVAQQRAELTDRQARTLLGEVESTLIAYAQLRAGPAPECVSGSSLVELVRFYVDRAWQGRGVAVALMDAAVDAAMTLGARTIWLGVWERNPRAIRFYAKHGFVDVGSHDFLVGQDRQTDRIMMRTIGR